MIGEPEPIKFSFIASMIDENKGKPRQEQFPVVFMCRMLTVSRQGFYQWRGRGPSTHDSTNAALIEQITAIHTGC